MPDTPAIILLSGGLDSATVLAIARSEQGGRFTCHTLAFDYGQRHRHELAAAELLSHTLGAASHRVVSIDLRAIGGSALTADIDVPKDSFSPSPREGAGGRVDSNSPSLREGAGGRVPVYPNLTKPPAAPVAPSIPITYVPARNLTFLSIAAGYAEVLGARDIFLGVNAVDYSGYPDCRPEFIEAFEHAANLGTKAGVESDSAHRLRIHAPLAHLSKADIIKRGVSLGLDYALTHSCYDPVPWHGRPARDPSPSSSSSSSSPFCSSIPIALACGHCDSCLLRRQGFHAAGIPDPTRYAEPQKAPKEPLA